MSEEYAVQGAMTKENPYTLRCLGNSKYSINYNACKRKPKCFSLGMNFADMSTKVFYSYFYFNT